MRAYFFGNMYLSSIQQGIQALHVVSDMFIKYQFDSHSRTKMLYEWAENHKTVVLLNAGYSQSIRDLCEFFSLPENEFPWEGFKEGNDALDGALTCVGIILPEKIYDTARNIREGESLMGIPSMSSWELELVERLNMFGLAK